MDLLLHIPACWERIRAYSSRHRDLLLRKCDSAELSSRGSDLAENWQHGPKPESLEPQKKEQSLSPALIFHATRRHCLPSPSFEAMAPKALPSRSVPSAVMKMMVPRVVAKAKPGAAKAAPAAAVATALYAASALDMVPCDFPITVEVKFAGGFGAELQAESSALRVIAVTAGALQEWNRLHPLLAVQRGDRITAVNHRSGDTQAMLLEIQAARPVGLRMSSRLRRASDTALLGALPVASMKMPPAEDKKRPLDDDGNSLYAGMPAPDPVKEKNAKTQTKDVFADPAAAEDPTSVVFLDIDGVLRRLESVPVITVEGGVLPLNLGHRPLLPDALRALKYIVHKTGAGVVISSEWRRSPSLLEEAQTALRALGMRTRGWTPVLRPREELVVGTRIDPDKEATLRLRWAERRAREITTWLEDHPEVKRWLALDDLDLALADDVRLPDTLRMTGGFFLIDPEVGLTMSHARQASEYLSQRRKPSRPAKVART
eukprot:s333_g17.t4